MPTRIPTIPLLTLYLHLYPGLQDPQGLRDHPDDALYRLRVPQRLLNQVTSMHVLSRVPQPPPWVVSPVA